MANDIEGTSRAYRLSGELKIRIRPTFLQARCRHHTLTLTAESLHAARASTQARPDTCRALTAPFAVIKI